MTEELKAQQYTPAAVEQMLDKCNWAMLEGIQRPSGRDQARAGRACVGRDSDCSRSFSLRLRTMRWLASTDTSILQA